MWLTHVEDNGRESGIGDQMYGVSSDLDEFWVTLSVTGSDSPKNCIEVGDCDVRLIPYIYGNGNLLTNC